MPSRRPNYRGERSHGSFLGKLKDYIISGDGLRNETLRQLSESYEVDQSEKSIEEIEQMVQAALNGKNFEEVVRTAYETIE